GSAGSLPDAKTATYREMYNGDATISSPDYPRNNAFVGTFPNLSLDETVGYEFAMPAGMFVSTVSREDADARAQAYADGYLRCVWRSPEIECACVDKQGGGDFDHYFYTEEELEEFGAHLSVHQSSGPSTLPAGFYEYTS